uniref:Deacetylase sirtuin-type domain-containing protein n=2 Tax=Parascaris univalens TaxID=6257 RepID=A0A915CC93_PARUN
AMFVQLRNALRMATVTPIIGTASRVLSSINGDIGEIETSRIMSEKKGTETSSATRTDKGRVSSKTEESSTGKKDSEKKEESEGAKLPNLYDRFVTSFENALASIAGGDEKSKQKLSSLTIEGIAEYIRQGKAKNIIFMVGAGISTSAGIPDFRSPGTGLYENLEEYDLPDPMCIFEINYFAKHPEPFYILAKKLFPSTLKPTPCHYFIRMMDEKGLLLRCYTQNIDSLEFVANINTEKLVTAHGSHHTSTCLRCHEKYDLKWITEKINDSNTTVARCEKCNGVVKPDIVFFGENLPKRFFNCAIADFPKCDLLIIMGTSLVVQPFAGMVNEVAGDVPRLLINLTEAGRSGLYEKALGLQGLCYGDKDNHRDVFWQGTCDEGALLLAELLGWKDELVAMIRKEWAAIDKRNAENVKESSEKSAEKTNEYSEEEKKQKQ